MLNAYGSTASLLSGTSFAKDASAPGAGYGVRFPQNAVDFAQDEEWCEVYASGGWHRLRLHDYSEIFRMPGLYEQLFGRMLRCSSPQQVIGLLAEVLGEWPASPMELRVLDLGAGNGMVGQELRKLGVRALLGADILPAAAEAARRDRPGLYDDYIVANFCDLPTDAERRIGAFAPDCLACVAALGFGDIPAPAFIAALNAIATPGWVAFNIKETFLDGDDDSAFCALIRRLSDNGIIQVQALRRYNHRLSISGQRLRYAALVARKMRDVPTALGGDLQ